MQFARILVFLFAALVSAVAIPAPAPAPDADADASWGGFGSSTTNTNTNTETCTSKNYVSGCCTSQSSGLLAVGSVFQCSNFVLGGGNCNGGTVSCCDNSQSASGIVAINVNALNCNKIA